MPTKDDAPYDAIAPRWDAGRTVFFRGEQALVDRVLDAAGAAPGDSGTILDLGCGTGRPIGEYVASRGHRVVGVDRSRGMLDLAARHVPGGRWVQADLIDVEFDAAFDGVICWDALIHVRREHYRAVLAKVRRWMKRGACLAITCGGSDAELPAFTDVMFEETFFYDGLAKGEMVRLVEASGFEVVEAVMLNQPDGGRDKGRMGLVARRGD